MQTRKSIIGWACLWATALALPSFAQKPEAARAASGEEFFIVSSVDADKKQLLLKYPTEVTELVLVNEKTVYLDEKGKALQFGDFRAGDTVYIAFARSNSDNPRTAARIRKSPMTLEELHRRYLKH